MRTPNYLDVAGAGAIARTARRLLHVFAAATAVFLPGAAAADRPVLTWARSGAPPLHFDGSSGRKGIRDEVIDWFSARLPQYAIETSDADILRSLEAMKATDGFCYAGLARTAERENFVAYSKRVLWGLPLRVVFGEADYPRMAPLLAADGSISIQDLLTRSGLVGGQATNNNLPRQLDDELARYGTEETLLKTASSGPLFGMLVAGRFNWTLFDVTQANWAIQSEFPNFRQRSVAISDNQQPIGYAIGCSNKPLGQRIIRDIDALIDANDADGPWQAYYDHWLDPESLAALNRAIAGHPDR